MLRWRLLHLSPTLSTMRCPVPGRDCCQYPTRLIVSLLPLLMSSLLSSLPTTCLCHSPAVARIPWWQCKGFQCHQHYVYQDAVVWGGRADKHHRHQSPTLLLSLLMLLWPFCPQPMMSIALLPPLLSPLPLPLPLPTPTLMLSLMPIDVLAKRIAH